MSTLSSRMSFSSTCDSSTKRPWRVRIKEYANPYWWRSKPTSTWFNTSSTSRGRKTSILATWRLSVKVFSLAGKPTESRNPLRKLRRFRIVCGRQDKWVLASHFPPIEKHQIQALVAKLSSEWCYQYPIFLQSNTIFNLYKAMPNKQQVLALYRLYYTLTRPCPDRSLKLYIRRRAKEDFSALRSSTPEQTEAEFQRLMNDAEVVRRQMQVRHLYAQWRRPHTWFLCTPQLILKIQQK